MMRATQCWFHNLQITSHRQSQSAPGSCIAIFCVMPNISPHIIHLSFGVKTGGAAMSRRHCWAEWVLAFRCSAEAFFVGRECSSALDHLCSLVKEECTLWNSSGVCVHWKDAIYLNYIPLPWRTDRAEGRRGGTQLVGLFWCLLLYSCSVCVGRGGGRRDRGEGAGRGGGGGSARVRACLCMCECICISVCITYVCVCLCLRASP